jgi:hypothetical protein
VHKQLKEAIYYFVEGNAGDSVHKTVKQLVDVLVLVQESMDACQKQGSQFLTEITERNRGPLHEAQKKLRDSLTLGLSLTVPLGEYTPWDVAARQAYAHHPGVLDVVLEDERSKLHISYGKVMDGNFCSIGFLAFDSNATMEAVKRADGKKRPRRERYDRRLAGYGARLEKAALRCLPGRQIEPYGEL